MDTDIPKFIFSVFWETGNWMKETSGVKTLLKTIPYIAGNDTSISKSAKIAKEMLAFPESLLKTTKIKDVCVEQIENSTVKCINVGKSLCDLTMSLCDARELLNTVEIWSLTQAGFVTVRKVYNVANFAFACHEICLQSHSIYAGANWKQKSLAGLNLSKSTCQGILSVLGIAEYWFGTVLTATNPWLAGALFFTIASRYFEKCVVETPL